MSYRCAADGRGAAASFAVAIAMVLFAGGQLRVCGAQTPAVAEPAASPPAAPPTAAASSPAPSSPAPSSPAPSSPAPPSPAPPSPAPPSSTPPSSTPPPAAASGAATTLTIDQPRPFGYVLGDTLTQRVLLDRAFQPETLPPLERAGLWFTRRSSTIQRSDDDRRWLVMQYQLVNAPQALMTVNLPEVTLKSKNGGVLTVPVWPISVGPLTPHAVFAKGGLQELRADHPAPMLPTSTLERELEAWLTAFAVTVIAWLAWWLIRSVRAAANQPFARAQREIRQLGEDNPDAWLALHRAFDRTAGRALQTSTLPALFKQAPHFESQRGAIEQFYSESNLRFFGGLQARAPSQPLALSTLAATLRRIEKQHER